MAPPDGDGSVLAEARELFATFQWRRCVELLAAADDLDAPGLMLLGDAAFLIGDDEQAVTAFGLAYQRFLEAGDFPAAARSAVSCGFTLDNAGEPVRARAWAARVERLVAEHDPAGAAAGWLLAYRSRELVDEGRFVEALVIGRDGERVGGAAGDADAVVLSRLSIGWALLLSGQREEAIDVYDEVMLAVSSEETSPAVVGLCYCASVAACMLLRDVVRARSWTTVLDRWVAVRPDLGPYRGTCLVHRAQMSTLGGDWASALGEAASAQHLLQGPAGGEAAYQLGELNRLMGREAEAEAAYRRANALGVQPEPGLSRLRTTQGRPDVAARTLRRLCGEDRPAEDRVELLAARVQAELVLGDVAAARATADELRSLTDTLGSPLLTGLADQSEGAVLLATGRPDAALDALRRAKHCWTDLDVPYAGAQVRVLAGRCLRALGEEESAELEFEAARACFERLGAAPDLAHLDDLTAAVPRPAAVRPGGLTEREVEVVRLVAGGHTNRAIAGRLCLSEKTVARHLANIYAKLDVPSRAAATAYAYDHGLV